jgi:hypothetical protein
MQDEIRDALSRDFSVDALRKIANLSIETLQQGHIKHPAVFHAIASVARWIADAWDESPLEANVAVRIQEQIQPALQAEDFCRNVFEAR